MKAALGEKEYEMDGKYLTWLKDSNDIGDDFVALRARLQEDGYLLIRGFHAQELVDNARLEMLGQLQSLGRLDAGYPVAEGRIETSNKGFGFRNNAKDYPAFRQLVNSAKTLEFFEKLLGGECLTYDTKWFRAVGTGGFSGAHYDNVYMGRGTQNVYTVWTPCMEIPIDMGGLALCLGSQNFDKVKKTYGQADYEKVSGWFSNDFSEIVDTFGGQWATTHFQAGDVLIFGMFMMHGSLTNKTDRYRMSADIRYQLKSELFDPRWHGSSQLGDTDHIDPKPIEMDEARKSWGV